MTYTLDHVGSRQEHAAEIRKKAAELNSTIEAARAAGVHTTLTIASFHRREGISLSVLATMRHVVDGKDVAL